MGVLVNLFDRCSTNSMQIPVFFGICKIDVEPVSNLSQRRWGGVFLGAGIWAVGYCGQRHFLWQGGDII